VTARRTPDSPPNDQVLVVCRRPDMQLEPTGDWNTLGLRGTCSPGFVLHATADPDLVCTDPYSEISSETMLPVSHCLWSAVWLGIADAAMDKARKFVQAAGRREPGVVPAGAVRLAESAALHQQMVDLVKSAADRFDATARDPHDAGVVRVPTGVGFTLAMNNLKVSTSTLVLDIVGKAMLVCGIAGYREGGRYSLGRHLRDAHGASVMVNNDRITANSARLALAYRGTM
ncbi:MAG: acyl-CoA/acyl-ACP dehydrogenase, partial [Nocardiaceae bacterium]|nr:acyl-CoA/acyl-ACP dehydrogenase [Nocardiaceae bacterium]